jgi:hypothetical protein
LPRPVVKIVGHAYTPRKDRRFCDKLEVHTSSVTGENVTDATYYIDGGFAPGSFHVQAATKVSFGGHAAPYSVKDRLPETVRTFILSLHKPSDLTPEDWKKIIPEGFDYEVWIARHNAAFYQDHKAVALANAIGWGARA